MTPPNILFIMSDDHAAHAISAYGSRVAKTPNIDRIAAGGMRLERCYVTNSICTPSRASILTGTYNHVNGVTTLDTPFDNRLPHVARHLQASGYQTAIFGKWHLGEGRAHEPSGFDDWCVVPGQGDYFDPRLIDRNGQRVASGHVTDVITDLCLDFLDRRDPDRPFFLMCHHKAPHRPFGPHPRYDSLYADDMPVPETFDDGYQNRASAAAAAKMRVRADLFYEDLGLSQPEGGDGIGDRVWPDQDIRKVPERHEGLVLIDRATGQRHSFDSQRQLDLFKYQRYMQRYLRAVAGIDDNVGRLLDWLDAKGLTENTLVIYTSDQGFFLGDHGWFDKRFMYEESLKMPFLIRYPRTIPAGSVADGIAMNVDFAPTMLDYAGVTIPSYMQGTSLRPLVEDHPPPDWQDLAYHRYWMHMDEVHGAFAHYGIRDHRWKLIYWYNDPLGQAGAHPGGAAPEWELFDCSTDPHELLNLAQDPAFAQVFRDLLGRLDRKMAEIGDIPAHDSAAVIAGLAGAAGTSQ